MYCSIDCKTFQMAANGLPVFLDEMSKSHSNEVRKLLFESHSWSVSKVCKELACHALVLVVSCVTPIFGAFRFIINLGKLCFYSIGKAVCIKSFKPVGDTLHALAKSILQTIPVIGLLGAGIYQQLLFDDNGKTKY